MGNSLFSTLMVLCVVGVLILLIHRENTSLRKKKAARVARQEAEAALEQRFRDRDTSLIETHISTLALKKMQLTSCDDYGNYQSSRWLQEIDYFLEHVVGEDRLLASRPPISPEEYGALRLAIGERVYKYEMDQIEKNAHLAVDVDSLDPTAFEHHCSEMLSRCRWTSRVTKAGGDQGIDVIANFGDFKAVFQCKKYTSPVGNSAVQEINAGKAFERADIAAVVITSTFTPAAKQLAKATGVHLLHFTELATFAEKLGLVET